MRNYSKMFKNVKVVFLDLSGTLHIENESIKGAINALKRLNSSKLKYGLLTNTTKESKQCLVDRLKTCGFDSKLTDDRIRTSLTAAAELVCKRQLRPLYLLEQVALNDFQDCDSSSANPNAVVVGLAPSQFYYERLNDALRVLHSGGSLIAIHRGRYYQKSDGNLHLGPGPFVAALEFASDLKAEVVGKPEPAFFLDALRNIDPSILPSEAVMIGDDAKDDVAGAKQAGFLGILVKTGKYRDGDETQYTPIPDMTAPSVVEAIDAILTDIL